MSLQLRRMTSRAGSLGFVVAVLASVPLKTAEAERGSGRDSLGGISTDTGAFAPGNRDFSHYTVPGMCVAAAQQYGAVLHRSLDAQRRERLLVTTPELDTFPTPARAVARACGTRFTVASAGPDDLPALFTLALLEDDLALARAVVARQVAAGPTAAARVLVFRAAAMGYLAARPARVEEAERVVASADSIARAAVPELYPLVTHEPLLDFARRAFDRPRMRHEAELLIAAAREFVRRRATSSATGTSAATSSAIAQVHAGYATLFDLGFVAFPDSLPALARRAYDDLRAVGGKTQGRSPDDVLASWLSPELRYGGGPSSVPPVVAAYWFPEKPVVWPPRGRATLLLYGLGCARMDADACATVDQYLPDWLARYGGDRLGVVFAAPTRGTTLLSGPIAPAQEADSIAWYYRSYRKFAATVAVVESAVRELVPPPDGRREHVDTTALGRLRTKLFGTADEVLVVLFGADGTPMYLGRFDYPLLNALLARAVGTEQSR